MASRGCTHHAARWRRWGSSLLQALATASPEGRFAGYLAEQCTAPSEVWPDGAPVVVEEPCCVGAVLRHPARPA